MEVLRAADIDVSESGIARSIPQAIDLMEKFGYPEVMKIVSRHILYKSDAGGVARDLLSRKEVIDAYEAIIQNVKAFNPEAVIDRCRSITDIEIREPLKIRFGCSLVGTFKVKIRFFSWFHNEKSNFSRCP